MANKPDGSEANNERILRVHPRRHAPTDPIVESYDLGIERKRIAIQMSHQSRHHRWLSDGQVDIGSARIAPLTDIFGGYNAGTREFDAAGSTSSEPIVAREYRTQGPTSFREAGEFERSIPGRTVASERVCSSSRNLVCTNDTVKVCTTPDTDSEASA